jgi:hypothetical protein
VYCTRNAPTLFVTIGRYTTTILDSRASPVTGEAHRTLSFSNRWSTHYARSVHLVLMSCHERYDCFRNLLAAN